MKIAIIYITNPNLKEAKKIAAHLLSKKLVACVNFLPIKSAYRWQGKIANSNEVVALAKTTLKNFTKVKKEVKKIHPYEISCIIKIEAEANKEYCDWLKSQVR